MREISPGKDALTIYDVWWRPFRRKNRKLSITTDLSMWKEIGRTRLEQLVQEEWSDPSKAVGSTLEVTDRAGVVVLSWKW